jgi:hypothetical protein
MTPCTLLSIPMPDSADYLPGLLFIAGAGQLCLALGSLAIPKLLGWPEDVARLRPLTRQIFWVYALYIWTSHVAFALLSMLARRELADGSVLAVSVTTFIALWWGARLILQFTFLDRHDAPRGDWYRWGEAALVTLFVFFTLTYSYAALVALRGA